MTPVTLLYTAALGGRLQLLPKIFTLIRQVRADATGPVLLVDLGQSCVSGSWICDVTGGRAVLVAMDAMGYDAFHIGPLGYLYTQPATVQQLRESLLTQFAAGPWSSKISRQEQTFVFVSRLDNITEAADLTFLLRHSDVPHVEVSAPEGQRLLAFDPGWTQPEPLLGRLDIALLPDPPYIELVGQSQ